MAPELALFTTALGLASPWQVVKVNFDKEAQELHLYVDFPSGSHFVCPHCDASCSVYDCEPDRLWRHLNFFEHKTFLHAHFPLYTRIFRALPVRSAVSRRYTVPGRVPAAALPCSLRHLC